MGWPSDEARRTYLRERHARNRAEWIAEQGNCCASCGGTARLEVDHVDRDGAKSARRSDIWHLARNNPKRVQELENCQVLCYGCHKEKSRGEAAASRKPHSERISEQPGCKCDDCRRNWRRRKGLAEPG